MCARPMRALRFSSTISAKRPGVPEEGGKEGGKEGGRGRRQVSKTKNMDGILREGGREGRTDKDLRFFPPEFLDLAFGRGAADEGGGTNVRAFCELERGREGGREGTRGGGRGGKEKGRQLQISYKRKRRRLGGRREGRREGWDVPRQRPC